MHLRYVAKLLGVLVILQSLAMILPLIWEIIVQMQANQPSYEALWAILQSISIGCVIGGGLLALMWQQQAVLQRREAMLLVTCAWFAGAAIAALPFWLWAQGHQFVASEDPAFRSFINSFFEAVSGLTTTGATILTNIESIPDSLLLWRSFTHWVGGLGIIVLFVIIMPLVSGKGGLKKLIGSETSGVSTDEATPGLKEMTRSLLAIYMSLTVIMMVCLKISDDSLSWLAIVTHSFATLGTGGFSIYNDSAASFLPASQWIMVLFMVAAGVNFVLYPMLLRGRVRAVIFNSELRFYFSILILAIMFITLSLWMGGQASSSVFRDVAFQVSSLLTSTGFASVDYDQWPLAAKGSLIVLMLIGGCAGSTAGGLKVVRILTMVKVLYIEIERSYRPKVIRSAQINRRSLNANQQVGVISYLLGILLLCVFSSLVIMITEAGQMQDGITAFSAVLATVNNMGPGFAMVGPTANFGWFSDFAKLFFCFLMVVGRLEFFAVMVLLTPRFWQQR